MNRDSAPSNGAYPGVDQRPSISIGSRQLRWWGAALGVCAAIADTAGLKWLGTSFAINGRDVSMFTAAWFGFSFAILGYLLGDAIDGRRREQRAAELIRTQIRTINESRAKLVQNEKLAALGQLAAAIAHEVRNPLAVIRSAAQSLGETRAGGQADSQRACSFITGEADRLGNLVNSLLAFAKPVQIAPRPVTAGELFDRALAIAGEELGAKHLRLRRAEIRGLPSLMADPDLICQVLVGLVANAAAAVPEGGEVALEARTAESAVELAVADSGPGVPHELRERVFEPFFTTRAKGVGLGLAVARQIVEAHGGRIEVGEGPGGGARFALTLPAARAQAA